MIQISRVTNPKDLAPLIPHLTLPEDGQEDVFVNQLTALLTQRPELVLVLVALKDNIVVGFVIADLGQGQTAHVRQAWVDPKVGFGVGTALNDRLKLWAVGHDRTRLEIRTQRSSEALYRRFGFEESAKILVQVIPEDFTHRVLESLKEVSNG